MDLKEVIIEGIPIFFRCWEKVLKEKQHPPYISLYLDSAFLRFLRVWPPQCNEGSRLSSVWFASITVLAMIFLGTIAAHFPRSANSIEFGDDFVSTAGAVMVFGKMLIFRWRFQEITLIISKFNRLHVRFSLLKEDRCEVRRLQRLFFLGEVFLHFFYAVMLGLLMFAMVSQPLFAERDLPYRALFPFGLHDRQRQPVAAVLVFGFQWICVSYVLVAIIVLDGVAIHIMSQTSLNLRILCVRLRRLGAGGVCGAMWADLRDVVEDHQELIELINDTNDVFSINYLAQLAFSTFLICLNMFELLVTLHQPMLAIKFVLYTTLVVGQIFYWCFVGNMVYFDSLKVADAAYEVQNWFRESPRFQRNLMIVIMRAQKPLLFRPTHFRPFEFQTFTWLISSSYSYLALLRNFND